MWFLQAECGQQPAKGQALGQEEQDRIPSPPLSLHLEGEMPSAWQGSGEPAGKTPSLCLSQLFSKPVVRSHFCLSLTSFS